jgi:hypothetical protein
LFEKASAILAEVGELDELARIKRRKSTLLSNIAPTSVALRALEETAALYRRLGDRAKLRDVLVNEAQQMLKSGDFQLARTKLREAFSEAEASGIAPGGAYHYHTGDLALSDANMDAVRDSLRALRRTGQERDEDRALYLEFQALRAQDRLQEARESLEREKALMERSGVQLAASGREMQLCLLSCDEGHPREGLECLAKHPPSVEMGDTQITAANLYLAGCRLLVGDSQGAADAARRARSGALTQETYAPRALAEGYFLRAQAARGQSTQAITGLRAQLVEAQKRDAKAMSFEIALALGDVELRSGRSEGRLRLAKLEEEARSKEFFRIARLAREALDQKGAPSPRHLH